MECLAKFDVPTLVLHGAIIGAMTWFRPSGRYSIVQYGDILAGLVLGAADAEGLGAHSAKR